MTAVPLAGQPRTRRPVLWNGDPVRARLLQQRIWLAIIGAAGIALIAGMYDAITQIHWYIDIWIFHWNGWSLKNSWDAGNWWPWGSWPDYRHYAFRDQLEPAFAVVFVMSLAAGPSYWKYRIGAWEIAVRLVLLLAAGIGLGILGVYLRDFGLPDLWHGTTSAAGHPGYRLGGTAWLGRVSAFTLIWGALMGLVLHRIWGPAGATIQGYWTDRIADRGRSRQRVAWYIRLPLSWPTLRERYSELYLDSSIRLARPGRAGRGLIAVAVTAAVLLIALGAAGKWYAGHGHSIPYLFPAG